MTKILILALMAGTLHAATVMRIACGSSTGGRDAQGNVWQSDAYFAGGTDYSRASMAALDLPYRALRYGAFTYSIPLANGDYTITLFWTENRTASSVPPIGAGQRKIAASLTGSTVIQVAAGNLDLFAVAGSMMPYSVAQSVGVLNGKLIVSVGPASPDSLPGLLSGIQVDSVDAPPSPPSVTFVTGLESAPPSCPAAGLTMFIATDTNHLFWCYAGSEWHVIGDVRNAPPQLVKLDQCTGSGLSFGLDGSPIIDPKTGIQQSWDCGLIYRAMIKRSDGNVVPLVGSIFDPQIANPAVWVAAK
jgi:hypothetical protein